MKRVAKDKPATYNHVMTVLPFNLWTHFACKQDTRIGDTVTSNNAESLISSVGEEVRLSHPKQLLRTSAETTAWRRTCVNGVVLGFWRVNFRAGAGGD